MNFNAMFFSRSFTLCLLKFFRGHLRGFLKRFLIMMLTQDDNASENTPNETRTWHVQLHQIVHTRATVGERFEMKCFGKSLLSVFKRISSGIFERSPIK